MSVAREVANDWRTREAIEDFLEYRLNREQLASRIWQIEELLAKRVYEYDDIRSMRSNREEVPV